MDWGFGNPNKTAVLIGCLMAACWLLARIRRGGFALALVSFVALGACLIHTYSRGGVVAAAMGQLVMLARVGRPWHRGRAIAIAVAFVALSAYATWDGTGAARRFGQSPASDRSISNRLAIWRAAPRMMVDAPAGWGSGRSGWAYAQWYQDPSTRYEYRTLVNSHLTWLVEMGWPGRTAYVAMILSVLAVCWPSRGGSAVPCAIWVVFLSGAAFSSTMEAPLLWVLPMLSLLHSAWDRTRASAWPPRTVWCSIGIGSAGAVGAMAIAGALTSSHPKIHGSPGTVHIGDSGPLFLLPDPDTRVLGTHYGMEIRRLCGDVHRPQQWIVCQGLRRPKGSAGETLEQTVVLSGRPTNETVIALKDFQGKRLVWLNPIDGAILVKIISLQQAPIRAFYGQRRSDSGVREFVEAAKARGVDHVGVRGAAMYLRQWASLLSEDKKTE